MTDKEYRKLLNREYARKHYYEHRDEILAKRRKRYAEDPEYMREYIKKWRHAHKDRVREYNQRHMEKLKRLEGKA